MGAGLRLKGQEVEVRVVSGANLVTTLDNISSYNDNMMLEMKQDGFLGEVFDRFDDVVKGYKGGFEAQMSTSNFYGFEELIRQRAQRENPALQFNIIRTDFFGDGTIALITFVDVKWGEIPKNVGARADFVKVSFSWGCSERLLQLDNLL